MNFDILNSIFEPTAVITEDLKLIYYNHYFSTFFKSSPRVLKKLNSVDELFTGLNLEELVQRAQKTSSVVVSKELKITLSDETELDVIVKVIPYDDNYIFCLNDISIEKNLYTKYRYQIEELKSIHEQILQENKLATVGEITANISHEISNPLTIASGTVELLNALLESDDLNSQKEVINTCMSDIQESFDRINDIVKGMKKFLHSKEDIKEYIDLESIINNSIKLLQIPLSKNNIEVNFTPVKDVYSNIFANRTKMEQVFVNFIKNSIDELKDVNNAKIDITISKDDVCYYIDVLDNGPGISKEIKDKIFDSFFTTKEMGEGTGLGLSISSKIIESYQGFIDLIESDKGAHFKITIPKMEVTSFTSSELNTENESSLKVLVVDNEPQVLNLFNQYISDLGHNLICSSGASEALKIIEDYDVDIIITDFFMPNKNGDELAKEIRELKIETPIYYLSGQMDQNKLKEDQLKYSIKGLISKPFTLEDIKKIFSIKGKK